MFISKFIKNLRRLSIHAQQLQHASPSEMRFSGKQEIMLSWIEVEWWWMQVLIGICQIPVFCCLDSPAVLGIWHRLCSECYLSPSAGKKTRSSYVGMDFHHISYELATLCCLLRFLISLSLWYFDCQFQHIKRHIQAWSRTFTNIPKSTNFECLQVAFD